MRFRFLIYIFLMGQFCFSQDACFPYQLNNSDYFLLPLGIGAKVLAWRFDSGQVQLSYNALQRFNSNSINTFDRSATTKWNTHLNDLSNVGKYALVASPVIVLLTEVENKQWNYSLTYGVMYFEMALVTAGITDLSKVLSHRKRPYLYNQSLSDAEKQELIKSEGGQDSFFSGTTSISFASAVFLSKTITDIYGKNTLSKIVWFSSMTLASLTAYLRYESGQHYPTDILAGAAIGSVIGYFIPVLHKNSGKFKNTSLMVLPSSASVAYKF